MPGVRCARRSLEAVLLRIGRVEGAVGCRGCRADIGAAPARAETRARSGAGRSALPAPDKFVLWLRQKELIPFSERCQWCGQRATEGRTCDDHQDLENIDQYEEAA